MEAVATVDSSPLLSEDAVKKRMSDIDAKIEGEEKAWAMSKYTRFRKNFGLATSMAIWITLFYIPVCAKKAHDWLFVTYDLATVLSSPDIESYWPNVVQMMFFTVFLPSGTTVQLAWQGMAGTIAASTNIFWMAKLFPLGGKCNKVGDPWIGGIRGFCEEYADPNYEKYIWVVWLDVIGFMLLVLASKSNENAMKFSLSWHMTYMMTFMSFAGYTPSHAVNITSLFGCALAIIATLFPYSQRVTGEITKDPLRLVKLVRDLTEDSKEFLLKSAYLSGHSNAACRYKFESEVNAVEGLVDCMQSNLANSWWETFNMGEFYSLRTRAMNFTESFDNQIGSLDDALVCMKIAVLGDETRLWKQVDDETISKIMDIRKTICGKLQLMNSAALALLHKLAGDYVVLGDSPPDKDIGDVATIRNLVWGEIEACIKDLEEHQGFGFAARKLIANINILAFSHITLTDKILQLAQFTLTKDTQQAQAGEQSLPVQIFFLIKDGLTATYNFSEILGKGEDGVEKRSFTFRNLLTLTITFVLGNFLSGNVFTPFSATMPGTLAVLISHFPGSAFYKNLMRLLGVTLGKVLPIIAIAAVAAVGTQGTASEVVHLAVVFLFMMFFSYMYYASPEWSYVGCLIAGFGCYTLVGTNLYSDTTALEALYITRYMEIGQVTMAIFVQIIIDTTDTFINKKFPRDVVTNNMVTLGVGEGEAMGQIVGGVVHFFSGSFDEMSATIKSVRTILSKQEALVPETADKTVIVRGLRPSFPHELYGSVLALITRLVENLEVLALVKDVEARFKWNPEPARWEAVSQSLPRHQFQKALVKATEMFQEVLIQDKEKALQARDLDQQAASFEEISDHHNHVASLRFSLVWRVINESIELCYEIERLCYASGRFS